jgi:glycyl-tRNA synthetase
MLVLTMQEALARLSDYWTGHGCLIVQPMNTEVGAGTLNPATFLRVLGPEPWRVGYVEPSVRPDDARYGENPNRLQSHTQYQVILKPEPGNAQELYLGSLAALGIDVRAHDVRFVEDNWASPALGAWGLGWEVWLDGLEITQFTYFQQAGGANLAPVSVEITYGMERIMMALQGARHFKEIVYTQDITYGEIFAQAEYEMSRYALDDADIDATRAMLELYASEARRMIGLRLPVPAHTFVLKCSHAFNVLDARGAISTAERAAEFARLRKMAGAVAELWVKRRAELGHPLGVAPAAGPAEVTSAAPGPRPVGRRHLLLEVGTEEMPPAEAQAAVAQLRTLMAGALGTTRLEHGSVEVTATCRRLVALVADIADWETDHEHVHRGPRLSHAFDQDGMPTRAALGFARSQNISVDSVGQVDVDGVAHLAVTRKEEGRDALTALAAVLPSVVTGLRSSKNMRWNDPALSFTRPIRWITALWGEQVVPFGAGALASGRITRVLRTSAEPEIAVASAETFHQQMEKAGIMLDAGRRRAAVEQGIAEAAASAGGTVDLGAEAELIGQINYLVEAPTPILGTFEPRYLELPGSVLTTVMRKHQRYIPVRDRNGSLLPYFVTMANGDIDAGVVTAGNESVLRARYEDASFFFRADSAVTLQAMRARLAKLTFADRLGSMHDRAERISAISRALADTLRLGADDTRTLDRARTLVKFDLGSQMVTELTSLAGTMAREYALGAGEPEAVAQALLDAELPRAAGSPLPQTPAGAILSLSDRLDYLCGLAATVGLPTGSSDPYALRRAATGLLAVHRGTPMLADLSLADGLRLAASGQPVDVAEPVIDAITGFLARRLETMLTEEGVPADWARAAMVHSARPSRVDRVLTDLAALIGTPECRRLVETMVRIQRIVPSGTAAEIRAEALSEPAEVRLRQALARTRALNTTEADLASFVRDTAELTEAVNAFFTDVLVMSDDPQLRAARLGLLASVAQLGAPVLAWEQLHL